MTLLELLRTNLAIQTTKMRYWAMALPDLLFGDSARTSLNGAGLVALADLHTVARRTALTGTSSLLDPLVICPGLHRQQDAPNLNAGEFPACAALTTGYVFRVENSAMVYYLQWVGLTGHLTTLSVSQKQEYDGIVQKLSRALTGTPITGKHGVLASLAYLLIPALTVGVLMLVLLAHDWWGAMVIGILIFARLLNTIVVRLRNEIGWKGAPEPGVKGDLLILLSRDRWIRMKGFVDDIKAVTSGQWLRDPTFVEESLTTLATLLVYLDAALAGNARQETRLLLLVLLLGSAALLSIANKMTGDFDLHGRLIQVIGTPKEYERRRRLAEELIKETGRRDWAVKMAMVPPEEGEGGAALM